jgi:hypothetical protein
MGSANTGLFRVSEHFRDENRGTIFVEHVFSARQTVHYFLQRADGLFCVPGFEGKSWFIVRTFPNERPKDASSPEASINSVRKRIAEALLQLFKHDSTIRISRDELVALTEATSENR